nr:general odorant binding protein 3 [Quadrastichus mendeli]
MGVFSQRFHASLSSYFHCLSTEMKIYINVAVTLLALVLVKCEIPEKVLKILEECEREVETLNVTPNTHEQKAKCFHACTSKKHGFMVNEKMIIDKAIDVATTYESKEVGDIIHTAITECVNKANEKTEECEVAGVYYKCYMEKVTSHYHS